ncbi:hypothetical protein CEXT_755021 [Caerostris extrusa]|uniref:Uncharacterized protein n=1 Tax=Caerostris extrusa TaxID=172846 RepID=A0AAV4U8W7_CAEEX|nr:hypothetical protein CEXT_755021 [Caerostris extrusa]
MTKLNLERTCETNCLSYFSKYTRERRWQGREEDKSTRVTTRLNILSHFQQVYGGKTFAATPSDTEKAPIVECQSQWADHTSKWLAFYTTSDFNIRWRPTIKLECLPHFRSNTCGFVCLF